MKQTQLSHKLVEYIPERLETGVLYVSERYGTAAHKCCCGCGKEVITPLTPTDWSLTIDGNVVTLYPSIGNWSFACQSHYWIKRSNVIWAAQMTQLEIERGRAINRADKQAYFKAANQEKGGQQQSPPTEHPSQTEAPGPEYGLWSALKRWWKF